VDAPEGPAAGKLFGSSRESSTNPDRDPVEHAAGVVRPAPAAAAKMRMAGLAREVTKLGRSHGRRARPAAQTQSGG
jgi:hypothetical protein